MTNSSLQQAPCERISPTTVFLYITSGFFLTNVPFRSCRSAVSFGAFVICSLTLLPLFRISFSWMHKKRDRGLLRHSLSRFIAVLSFLFVTGLLCCYESLSFLVRLYENVGNPPSRAFCVILCAVLFAVSLFSAFRGFGTLSGMADIAVILPVITLVLCLFGFFGGGGTATVFGKAEGTLFREILSGALPALLVFADSFTVLFLTFPQAHKTGCDAGRKAKKPEKSMFSAGYLASLLFFCLSFLLLRSLFGVEASSRLAVPFASATAMIPGLDAEELFVFFFSFCILYRCSVRLCFASECFTLLGLCGRRRTIAGTAFAFFLFLSVSVCFMREEVPFHFYAVSPAGLPVLSGFAFVLLPLLSGLSKKE